MPRPNRPRSIASEAAVARRIAILCKRDGVSYPELARRMTDAGCPIQVSALYRLQSDPPRGIRVNELIALANVFDLEVTDLLRSPEEVEREWVGEVTKDLLEAARVLDDAQAAVVRAFVQLAELAADSAEMEEAVRNQWKTATRSGLGPRQWFADLPDTVDEEQLERCVQLSNEFWEAAAEIATRSVSGS